MMAHTRFLASFVLAAAGLAPGAQAAVQADLSRLVVVGDSLSAGFQNSCLLGDSQVNGYASLVAAQAGVSLALPLVEPPGAPPCLELLSLDPLVVEAPLALPGGRSNPFVQAFNLAVPGARVGDALDARPDLPIDSMTDLVLGLPGLLPALIPGGDSSLAVSLSQIEWAAVLQPTTVLVWLGNNDALGAVIAADPAALTPFEDFELAYEAVMDALAATGATLAVANIPDVTVIPFLVSADELAAFLGLPLELIAPILGLTEADFVTLDGFDAILATLANPALGPLPEDVVLTAAELATIRAATAAFNAVIAREAAAHGAAFVDTAALLGKIDDRGSVVGGRRLTTDFLGGLFTLDGVHPTNTGYARVANAFIRALNRTFEAGVSPVNVLKVSREDPLILPFVGRPPAALGALPDHVIARLRAMLAP